MQDVGIRVAVDGEAGFNQSLQNLVARSKEFSAELKNVKSSMDGTKGSTTQLNDKIAVLSKQISNQKTYIDELTQKYNAQKAAVAQTKAELEAAKATYGANSSEVQKLETQLNKQDTAMAKTATSVNNAKTALNAMQSELKQTQTELSKSTSLTQKLEAAQAKLSAAGAAMTSAGRQMTTKVTAPILAAGAAVVKVSADFESSMSQVQATMGITTDDMSELDGQTVNTMKSLEELARTMGKDTAFSAKEAGDAINYLALAGYSTQQMFDVLPSVLSLASAGSMDLAAASDMVTDAMSALGIDTSQAATYVDQMAKTASTTNTSVSQLGEGILQIGATAKSIKGGTAELNTALGILANNGIKGAEGGTHLRNVILSLQSPTDKGAAALRQLGVDVYDSEGKMRSLNDVLGDMNVSMKDMTQAEKANIITKIFNKTDLAAVNTLLDGTGSEWDDLTKAITDSGGAAKKMADTQLDNMSGKLTILKSKTEGLSISLGEILAPKIEKIIEGLQKLVDRFQNLDPKTQEMIISMALVAASIGPVLLVLGSLATSISSIITLASTLAPVLSGPLAAAFGPVGLAIAGAVAAGVLLWQNWDTVKEKALLLKEYLGKRWGEIKQEAADYFNGAKESITGAFDKAKKGVSDTVGDMKEAIDEKITGIKKSISWIFEGVSDFLSHPFSTAYKHIKQSLANIFNVIANFRPQFPHIKMPHFSWTWNDIGGLVKVPSISVSWYDKGGIFSRPSVIGVGERRPEFVGALDDLRRIVREEAGAGAVTVNVYGTSGMNEEALADKVVKKMQNDIYKRRTFA